MGLTQRPLSGTPWLCPQCAPNTTELQRSAQRVVCVCDTPPYITGPVVRCARDTCSVGLFHWACAGYPGDEGEWICGVCVELEAQRRGKKEVEGGENRGNRGDRGEGDDKEEEDQNETDALSVLSAEKLLQEAGFLDAEKENMVQDHGDGNNPMHGQEPEESHLERRKSPTCKMSQPQASLLTEHGRDLSCPASAAPISTPTSTSTPHEGHKTPYYPSYCICGTPETREMIACHGAQCSGKWFHYECVGMTAEIVPGGKWVCEGCAGSKV